MGSLLDRILEWENIQRVMKRVGRTLMMSVGLFSGFSISTFSTTIRLTPAMNIAKLEIVTGLFS